MSAGRRVRVARTSFDDIGRSLRSVPVARFEFLFVSSRCEGRPDIWEWRLGFARIVSAPIGRVVR